MKRLADCNFVDAEYAKEIKCPVCGKPAIKKFFNQISKQWVYKHVTKFKRNTLEIRYNNIRKDFYGMRSSYCEVDG